MNELIKIARELKIIASADDIASEPGKYKNFTGKIKTENVGGTVEKATFEIKRDGGVDWERGTWKSGYFHKGIWKNGIWENGRWFKATWKNGSWKNGSWYGGTWEKGVWRKGRDPDNQIRTEPPNTW